MKKLKETLWADYDKVSNQIGSCEELEKYKLLLEERDKIRNEILKLEQGNVEADLKRQQMINEVEVKSVQINSEASREKIRNYINLGTFTVSTSISLIALYKTFKFDEVATVTSTMGRNILNGFVPKMFKR